MEKQNMQIHQVKKLKSKNGVTEATVTVKNGAGEEKRIQSLCNKKTQKT